MGASGRRISEVQQHLSIDSRSAPMRTVCSALLFGFADADGRKVVGGFDGKAITADAWTLLLGAADRAIRLTERFAVMQRLEHRDPRMHDGTPVIGCDQQDLAADWANLQHTTVGLLISNDGHETERAILRLLEIFPRD